jgi:hypothetical protein
MQVRGNTLVFPNRLIFISLFLFYILLAVGCQPKETNQLTEKEYSVYLTVIGKRPGNLIVVDESAVDRFGEVSSGKLSEILPGIFPDTIDDWVLENREPLIVPDDFPFKTGYKVVSAGENIKSMPAGSRSYVVSRAGFSKDGKQAIVRFYFDCGALCGDGAFYLLNNVDGIWRVEKESEHWKS